MGQKNRAVANSQSQLDPAALSLTQMETVPFGCGEKKSQLDLISPQFGFGVSGC